MGRIVGRQQRGRDGEEIERGRHGVQNMGQERENQGKIRRNGEGVKRNNIRKRANKKVKEIKQELGRKQEKQK